MSIPVQCKQCGYRGIARTISISNSTNITFQGGSETCPACGGRAEFQSGTYDFVGETISAFRAPGMTREKVAHVGGIVSRAAKGEISPDEAVQQVEDVSSSLGALLRAAHQHGITFDRVLAVILAIQAFWTAYSSDADVQAALAESRTQTELAQKMLAETQAQTASLRELATKPTLPPQSQAQTNAPKNRAERRKAAAIERRKKPQGG